MKEFILPELGENIESASILKVLVAPGDVLELDQAVLEIETDKATIEVPSTVSGMIKDVFVKDGEKIKVGQVILRVEEIEALPQSTKTIQTESKTVSKKNKKAVTNQQTQPSTITEFKLPELGENIESANVLKILVSVGDVIQKEQGILEIETDKATIEVPSTIDGKVIELLVKEGKKAKVGQVVLRVEVSTRQPTQVKSEKKVEPTESVEEKKEETIEIVRGSATAVIIDNQPAITLHSAPAAPSVRRLAREIGVDINQVPGSGPDGRIRMADVKAYSKKLHEQQISASGQVGIKAKPLPDFSKFGEVERKEMSNIRSKTADHLSYAWSAIPHVTQFDKADITDLEKVRKGLSTIAEKEGTKLTVTSFLLKIISSALKEFPQFNASVDIEKKAIVYKKYINIGVAVDTENGLIVPVLKNVDQKNLFQLTKDMNELAEKARKRKIGLDEMQGGCFTISNLGGIGGTYFTPIVNSPEVAILGVSRGAFEPVYKDGQFIPRLMLPLSLSYDHRLIDGADAIRFLRWIVTALENPSKFLMQ
ncbi:MAG: branched-chain alpha-keto acid dehydrogenase subunit E2 [Ignavibacteria bacterium CG_4_8_14_3_um_filter_37_9]|nr:dihydrolipoyllysine-residue acetyltransferase [Ignavibacteria bacterium]PIP76221.1 MAG: branched-chain alpha-keto acid dehydrogenase subunit E2 [Ignavibacteria bacterium CG22_combo_CG10-13_8_21_14_all_37_15]PIW98475.1 MAG: branched-chain alpha-keto acid dehydrogenase subunit E2 [Ignavibacteria bacterium CG_4_8_14_3_um_filter_37_9]PIX95518.1 MAG: branched-chain alpha-keto acid dehydrogenase subunit E2 [Ignavibacteria bacterium CG_4_10_14_3_um_filter_37_18]PJC57611.1 MAG: branched-chain alpha-